MTERPIERRLKVKGLGVEPSLGNLDAVAPSPHSPGPWRACKDGECVCGQVWSIPQDFPVFTVQIPPQGRWTLLDRMRVFTRGFRQAWRGERYLGDAHTHMADEWPDAVYASIPPATAKANARLVAAAPDLLEACRALQMEARARDGGLRIADEAIAKALGCEGADLENAVGDGSSPQTPSPAPRGEEGWVLVPREPTDQMLTDCKSIWHSDGDGLMDTEEICAAWRALIDALAAAPKAPLPGGEEEDG